MPIQIWTRDMVPELMARGAEGLGGGIADFGAGIGKAIDESKRLNTAGKAAKTFLDALNEAGEAHPDAVAQRKQIIASLSSKDAIAQMTGTQQAIGYKKAQAELQDLLTQITARKEAAANAARQPAFLQRLAEAGTAPGDLPFDISTEDFDRRTAPIGLRSLGEAAAHTRYSPGNQVDDLLKMLRDKPAMSLEEAIKAASNPPAGFEKGTLQVNPNGTPGLSYTPKPEKIPSPPPPPGLQPTGFHVDEATGKASTTYGTEPDRRKALTDAQANALQYSERMKFNNGILDHIEKQGFSPATVSGTVQGASAFPNFMASEPSQQYQAAARNWISAVLRKESGAAISKSEEVGALNQYFPKLGDAPSVIKQKADLRQLAEENMRRAIGNIDEAGGKTNAVPKAAAPVSVPAAAPKEPSQRKKDTIYQTPRGPMKWTGTVWLTP